MNIFVKISKRLGWFIPFLLAASVVGCGGSGGGSSAETVKPTVTATTPAGAATGVAINTKVTATFSEAMTATSLTATTFSVAGVTGTVAYDATNHIATLTPAANFAASTAYTATITTGAKDMAGNAMAADKTWTFTTGTTTDATAPTVSVTLPAASATSVTTNSNLSASFSEAMDSATISTTTVTVMQGATPVAGSVVYAGTTATFNPTADFAASTVYTATVTTGATDLAGVALAGNYVWTFTTGTAAKVGPAPVALGTAGNFAILSKAGVSTTGVTAITGDVGASPIDSTAITGFGLVMDATNTFSTSSPVSLVTGKIYAANYTAPTPSNLTTSISNMETAYIDAAGRTVPAPVTELGAGEIGGLTITPGLYKWSSNLLISTDVTLNGGPNDVWIFQIAGGITQANGTKVLLAGGALPKNIFWQTSGTAAIGTTAHFEGIILSLSAINLNTGATMNGRALAQTAVSLDANTITQPAP